MDGITRFHRQDSNLNLSRDKRSNSLGCSVNSLKAIKDCLSSQPVAYYVVEHPTT